MKSPSEQTGKRYWRSLEELGDPGAVPAAPPEESPSAPDDMSRRNFLGIMGAAFALSGLAGCSRPVSKILPYSKMPEDVVPGLPLNYATAWDWRGVGEGLLATSHEGRPTKLEGNPEHPVNRGKTDVYTQASILSLYDPDRAQTVSHNGNASDWAAFDAWFQGHKQELSRSRGAGLAFLSGYTSSPLREHMRQEITRAFPRAAWHTFESVDRNQVLNGARTAFGRPVRTHIDFSQADVVLALDSDFLGSEVNMVRNAGGFARARRIGADHPETNRLYVIEPGFTVTGSSADHRLPAGFHEVGALASAVANALGIGSPGGQAGAHAEFVTAVAEDLRNHRGRAVVVAGAHQPAHVHALVHAMNDALGAVGPVVRYTQEPLPASSLSALQQELGRGAVDTVVILGGNPVYEAAGDLKFAEALGKASHVIYLGSEANETAVAAEWHLPQSHYLEAWGDARAYDGTVSVVQPLIAPLYPTRSALQVLAGFLDQGADDSAGHSLVQDFYRDQWGASFEERWRKTLHDGIVADSAYSEVSVSVRVQDVVGSFPRNPAPDNGLEVIFRECPKVYDGRFANNAWLQELPDPVTKLTWDNVIQIAPADARELGLASGDTATLSAGGESVTGPVWVQPGHAPGTVTLTLGYGRTASGRVGTGVGFDVSPLRAAGHPQSISGATLTRTGDTYPLATTQHHWKLEDRPHIRQATVAHYEEHPDFAKHQEEAAHREETMYFDREYEFEGGNQWGMTIDLSTCTGCNACVVGCQSENNISTVGKDQVMRGREMHWIRIDRYFEGEEDNPQALQQPVPCQQCENAPCEAVCPVNATAHSDEGLNDMVYNRCIGTRYCANNCPYKVRRFNFYDYNKEMTEVEKMLQNPNVTVRMRGVMEKCTYCVQRINRAKIDAKVEGRDLADGEIKTACQQVCPTDAITFGNLTDPESRVSKFKAEERDYSMLSWIGTYPRTSYLARITNPNPKLEPHS